MIRHLGTMGLAAALAMICVTSDAAEPAHSEKSSVDSASLEAMGLGGIQVMARGESEQLRGQGAIVFGRSYAFQRGILGYSSSTNGYRAFGRRISFGANYSTASTLLGTSSAGGFSVAGGF